MTYMTCTSISDSDSEGSVVGLEGDVDSEEGRVETEDGVL